MPPRKDEEAESRKRGSADVIFFAKGTPLKCLPLEPAAHGDGGDPLEGLRFSQQARGFSGSAASAVFAAE